jgi:two-component system cell cycle sensor histidine kinase/response regulator CckA
MRDLLASRHVVFETTLVAKDGSGIPVEIRSDAFTLHGRTLILSLARDVAERRQMQEQLLEAQKLEAVGRLAGGVAHDFNNVLTVIQGNADLLLRSFQPGHPQRELVEEILDAAKGAAEMTGRLLAFARRRRVQPSVFDVNELLGGMRRVLQRLLGDRIELALVPGRESVRVKVDPGQIEQVLINLAVNARDAMPGGGRLVLETGVLRVDGAYPVRELSAIVAGTYATIAVTDTGEGMTAEVRSHIFEPFFTTKGRGGGTGLGLATVYAVVQQHAGHITVDSEPGRGTTFRLFLPCVDEQAAAVAGGPTQTPAAPGSATILVVEDDPPVRRFTADALRRIGYAVLTAEDGADALRILTEQNGKTVDLVLADVMMPGMDGRELVRRIQELHPSIAAVLMSASASIPPPGGAESPPGQMLGKPFTVDQLAHHVARVLAVRR